MTQEQTAVAKQEAQVETLQETVTEAEKQGATPQEITELRAKLDAATKEINQWQSEAKGQQRAAKKSAQQLEDWQAFKTSMESQISVVAEMVADMMDKNPVSEDMEDSTKRKSTSYRDKFQSVKQSTQTAAQEVSRQRAFSIANEAASLISPTGLDMQKSPELRTAYALFRAGDYDEALEETKKVVNAMTEAKKPVVTAKTETPEEMEKRIREDERKKTTQDIYKEKGWNISDTGGGTGGGKGKKPTLAEIKAATPAEFDKKTKSGEWVV